jgi:hypothetical protein
VLDLAVREELRHDLLDRVDRDGEADSNVATRIALDLRIDSDDPAVGIQERAARVSVVDGRVRLDGLVDRKAVGRGDLALERGDDAGS